MFRRRKIVYGSGEKCSTVIPLNTADLGTSEKAAVFQKRRYWESYITYKTLIWDLKMGGGIGREAVLGWAVLRGTTVFRKMDSLCPENDQHSG